MPSPDPTWDLMPLIKALTSGEPISVRPVTDELIGYIPVYRSPLPHPDQPPTSEIAQPRYPGWITTHPLPKEAARKFARNACEAWPKGQLHRHLRDWMDLLRAAATPDEQLTCERMIAGLGEAIGRRMAGRVW